MSLVARGGASNDDAARALDDAAASLRARFRAEWDAHRTARTTAATSPARSSLRDAPLASTAPASPASPPPLPDPILDPPLVRHRALDARLAAGDADWEASLARDLAEDVHAASAFVLSETSRLARAARALVPDHDAHSDDLARHLNALDRRRDALDVVARRAALVADLLEHDVDAAARVLEDWTPLAAEPERHPRGTDPSPRPRPHPRPGVSTLDDALDHLLRLRRAFEPLVLRLGEAHDEIRVALAAVADGSPRASSRDIRWRPPACFERKTTKYWVDLADVTRLKIALARYLPVLVYDGERNADSTGAKDPSTSSIPSFPSFPPSTSPSDRERDSGLITSTYFDDDRLDAYHSRLERHQGATLLRARWYGERIDERADGDVFVERKTHHESWSLDGSVKERFRLRRGDLEGYVRGEIDVPARFRSVGTVESERAARLAEEVTRFELEDRSLVPALSTRYRRTAFQRADTNAVRVSLDVDVRFEDARGVPLGRTFEPDPTHRAGAAFPYAVLEVKLQEEAPAWIEDAVSVARVVEVRKFSKFLTGTATTRGADVVRRVPHWITDETRAAFDAARIRPAGTIARLPTLDFTVDSSSSSESAVGATGPGQGQGQGQGPAAADAAEHVAVRVDVDAAPGTSLRDIDAYPRDVRARATVVPVPPPANARTARRRRMVPIKVEPKTFFANERTLLQWLSMSILLLFMSLALLSLDTAPARASTPQFGILARETSPDANDTRVAPFLVAAADSGPPDPDPNPNANAVADSAAAATAPSLVGAYDASALARYNRVASGVCGAVLAPMAIAFMVYALSTYVWRSRRIARREPSARYDDVWGPVALTCALVTVSAAAVALAIAAHPWR
jgi:uncharacterized membrane protein YidH (DUF202 family)